MKHTALRQEIVELCLRAYGRRLFAGTSGNLSVWLPEEEIMLITPTGVRYETMTPEEIVAVRLDGTVIGGGKPSSEWQMHGAIYRALPEVRAVFHTHSQAATAFAAAEKPIPDMLIEMGIFLGGDVPCAPFEKPGTLELGEGAARAMQNRNACLLARHGVVAVGRDLPEAYIRAEYVEDSAEIAWRAMAIRRNG